MLALVFVPGPVLAITINEFEAGYVQAGSPIYDGLKGNQEIRTDIATVAGVAYVHITQIDTGSIGGDFVAVGTVKGQGTSPGNCTTHNGPGWTGYIDGETAGVYFCSNFNPNHYGVGANPSFEIAYQNCPGFGNSWVLIFDGALRGCKLSGSSDAGAFFDAGLEVVSPDGTDRNVDVRYSALMRNTVGSESWTNFGTPLWIHNASYTHTFINTTKFDVFLAPLN